jgi:hypothetical protein
LNQPSRQKVSVAKGAPNGASSYEPRTVTLMSQTKTLSIIFKDSTVAYDWLVKLTECVSSRPSYTEGTEGGLGNIFDITFLQSGGTWRDFKVTFVKHTWSSEEFLLFDSSQEDLSASSAEVYQIIDARLDLTNQRIFMSFLNQAEAVERSERMTKKHLQPSLPSFAFDLDSNKRLLRSYRGVDIQSYSRDISSRWTQFLRSTEDPINEAFSLIELQKATQVLRIADFIQNKPRDNEIKKYREQINKGHSRAFSEKEIGEIDAAAAHIAQVKRQRKQADEDDDRRRRGMKVPERSCGSRMMGDACDCRVF